MKVEVRLLNFRGDEIIANYDNETKENVEIAIQTIEDFWNKCIREFGQAPITWGKTGVNDDGSAIVCPIKRRSENKTVYFEDDLCRFQKVFVQFPLVGG